MIIDSLAVKKLGKKTLSEIRGGKIFVYPTDTIYGIGCNALDARAVKKIRELKGRFRKPFSVIAPSKSWIAKNCFLSREARVFMEKNLPGRYTLVLRLKRRGAVSRDVNAGLKTLGVRIPKNWFSRLVARARIPFVTTSVNKAGKPPMTSLGDADKTVLKGADYVIYEGARRGKPSKVIDFTRAERKILRR